MKSAADDIGAGYRSGGVVGGANALFYHGGRVAPYVMGAFAPETAAFSVEDAAILSLRRPGAAANAEVGAANAALHARYLEVLRASEAANAIVESLRTTGRLPPNYVTFGQAQARGWSAGKALDNYLPGAQIVLDIHDPGFGLTHRCKI